MRQRGWRISVLAGLLMLGSGLGLTACGAAEEGGRDGAGMTEREAAASIETQFQRVKERHLRMYELLTDAQLHVSDGLWERGHLGVVPVPGPNAWSVRGMGIENSYYLGLYASIHLPGGVGEKKDLDPMLEYFESKGWPVKVYEWSTGWAARADTGEGFMVTWQIQQNGQYNIDVMSKTFWGSGRQLQREVVSRIPPENLDFSDALPGVKPKFPNWDDPATHHPVTRRIQEGVPSQ